MNREHYRKAIEGLYKFASWLHLWIFILILVALVLGIVGFAMKWFSVINHPAEVLNEFHGVAEDIFSLILVFEIMELLRLRNPVWLMDIFLTVLVRKMLLSPEDSDLILLYSLSFCVVVLCRILYTRLAKEHHD